MYVGDLMFDIEEELKRLPDKPGVYLMKNKNNEVIYVGKAKVIKNRVRSYFQKGQNHNKKTIELVSNIVSFEYIVTDTEMEALILECNLIKKYYPKYNIALKDNKGYPYIKITNGEFPRVYVTKNYLKDDSTYYGPYTSATSVYEVMELIDNLWLPRTCKKNLPKDIGKGRACLNYHIKKCSAPCIAKIDKEEYGANIQTIRNFLNGDNKKIVEDLKSKMLELSENLEFEKAGNIRDKIFAINKLSEKQKIEKNNEDNKDIIAVAKVENTAMVQIFFIRKGRMLGREQFIFDDVEEVELKEILNDFIKQFYSDLTYVPEEIIVEYDIEEELLKEWLMTLRGGKVTITVPKKGEKLKLLNMAYKNASLSLLQFGDNMLKENNKIKTALNEIEEALGIDSNLTRIESYDISNVQGYESVGSMIVFNNGKPKKEDYRKFKIKTVVGPDDYKSMYEVISRRFNRYVKEISGELKSNKFNVLPDIILVDGGQGQITSAKKATEELGLDILIAGIVKDDKHRTRGLLYNGKIIEINKRGEGFKLLTRIQDEVHRFALEYHRKLRTKTVTNSKLDEIKGVGPARRTALYKHFGTIEKIKEATLEELEQVDGVSKKVANDIYLYFNNDLLK